MKEFQKELNKVERFVKKSTEHYDDWDWDGEKLVIIIDDEVAETYSKADLKEEGIL